MTQNEFSVCKAAERGDAAASLREANVADGNGGTDMKRKYQTMTALILSAALIIIGVMEGQNRQVFVKAVNICLECVGLG